MRTPRTTLRRISREAGFTLLESVVWVAMFTMVMGAVVSTIIYFYRASAFTYQEASAISSAQHGMDLMIRTIRETSYASNGAYPVVSMSTSSMTFYSDMDTDSGIERIHYYLTGNNLIQGITDPTGDPPTYASTEATTSISDNVRNNDQGITLFTYYDSSGVQMSDLSQIGKVRFVTMNMVVDIDPNRTPTTTQMRSSAALRNLIGQ